MQQPIEAEREAFLTCWGLRQTNLRHARAVDEALSGDNAAACRRWIAEHEAEEAGRLEREREALLRLRASITGKTPLLAPLCESEGISLAAVIYGILPAAWTPFTGDGHPWTRAPGDARRTSIRKARTAWSSYMLEPRRYVDAGEVREWTHPDGPWTVVAVDGTLQVELSSDRFDLRTTGSLGTISVPTQLPRSAMAAARGRKLRELVDHPALEDDGLVITSVTTLPTRSVIRFRARPVPLAMADVGPTRGLEWQQLGRDGRLAGAAAVADIVARCVGPHEQRRLSAEAVADILESRLHRINMMAPPWAETLPAPSVEEVARVLTSSGVRQDEAGGSVVR